MGSGATLASLGAGGWEEREGHTLTFLSQVLVLNEPGQAKISDFAAERLRDEDVGSPEVPVDEVHALDVGHALCHLGGEEEPIFIIIIPILSWLLWFL